MIEKYMTPPSFTKRFPIELFFDFERHLSKRDALIAQMIYLSYFNLTRILNLKVGEIEIEVGVAYIGIDYYLCKFPERSIGWLKQIMDEKEPYDLLFCNRNGEKVDRSRIYRSFSNAGLKVTPPLKITPSMLCELH